MIWIAIFLTIIVLLILLVIFPILAIIALIWTYRPELSLLDIAKMAIHELLDWILGKGDE